jgi:hypothetical protein
MPLWEIVQVGTDLRECTVGRSLMAAYECLFRELVMFATPYLSAHRSIRKLMLKIIVHYSLGETEENYGSSPRVGYARLGVEPEYPRMEPCRDNVHIT